MSMARTALRIAAVAALNADPAIDALCQGRIYDSRIDELDAKDPVPTIVVYTEDDTGTTWSKNNGGPPFDHQCDLLIEISMRVVVPPPIDDETGEPTSDDPQLGVPETDAEAEAALDFLEERAVEAVTIADTAQARLIRSTVLRRATELKSIRFSSANSGGKLALRMVSLTTRLKINEPSPFDPAPTGPFATLPEPLRTVAEAQPEGSALRATCLAIAAKLTIPTKYALEGVDAAIQPVGEYDPANPPDQSDPLAPDPVYSSFDLP